MGHATFGLRLIATVVLGGWQWKRGNRMLCCCCDLIGLYRGCRGFWLGVKVQGWVGFRGVSVFCLLRRRDILSNRRVVRCSRWAID